MILHRFVDEQNRARYYVLHYEGWDDFERLVHYVERSLNGNVTERIDGPDARVWTVAVKGWPITYTHNGMLGNCFFSEQEGAAAVVQEIVRLLERASLGSPAEGPS
jgi:hypothetical protein